MNKQQEEKEPEWMESRKCSLCNNYILVPAHIPDKEVVCENHKKNMN